MRLTGILVVAVALIFVVSCKQMQSVQRTPDSEFGPDRFLPNGSYAVVDWTNQKLIKIQVNGLGTSSAAVDPAERLGGYED